MADKLQLPPGTKVRSRYGLEICDNCQFYDAKGNQMGEIVHICRESPRASLMPTPVQGGIQLLTHTFWASPDPDDWCSHFKTREQASQ